MKTRIPLAFLLLAPLTVLAAPDAQTTLSPDRYHPTAHANRLVTTEGEDPPFVEIIKSGSVTPGERFSKGPVHGSSVSVNHELLEKQAGKPVPIPKQIGIHTQASGGIRRGHFPNWTRWYQEDGNVQVFRLFKGEQNIRNGVGAKGSQGRIEAFTPALKAEAGGWREWEGTYTIIKPVAANIFQLFHIGSTAKGGAILWPFHVRMTGDGDIYFHRRRSIEGMEAKIVLARNMTGKSLSIKVRANGEDYELYQKDPLDEGPWKFVTRGSYTKSQSHTVSFRWGMYCGSKKGQVVSNDALLLVSGANIR